MKPIRTVLVSGASVAGPSLAFWLARMGFAPTVVERAPALRDGGHAVDFRGTAMEVLRRMGLVERIKAAATNMGDMHYVDRRDRTVATLPSAAFSGELEIMRGDLARILYDETASDAEYIFGDSIASLNEHAHGVEVRFESGEVRTFDFVIGADGQHSNVRARVFGPERDFVHQLGLHVSIFTMPNRPGLDYAGHLFPAPGSIAGIYSARDNREARALLFFSGAPGDVDYRDIARQKAIVRERFAGQGWYVPEILSDMETAPDFYFDSVCQVKMHRWSKGRVALLGDAAWCASPLSGMGTGMAVVGAYKLAHRLAESARDCATAFAAYEADMRPFVAASQDLAQRASKGFVARSPFAIWARNQLIRFVLPRMPSDMITKDAMAAANAVTLEAA